MRKGTIFLLVILIIGISFFTFADSFTGKKISNPFFSPSPFPTIPSGSSQQPITIAPSASKNIEVLSPRTGDVVKSGFMVKGNARVFENVVSIKLLDSSGNILVQTFTNANAPDTGQFGLFEEIINYQTTDKEGILEVFQNSAKDGTEIDKVTIPLIFAN